MVKPVIVPNGDVPNEGRLLVESHAQLKTAELDKPLKA
jgi:hypothetical protein